MNQAECAHAYMDWWRAYLDEFHLWPILEGASGLSDMFGQVGHVCQAITLWELIQERQISREPHHQPETIQGK